MLRLLRPTLACAALAGTLAAADFYPLDRVRAGMKGVGRSVFAGERVEEFSVEILGVLENIGPRQSIVLGKLSGGPLARTGVLAGMSGSPVYLDGKLLGAVALGFPFATEPIAGIRPISEMVETFRERGEAPPASLRAALAKVVTTPGSSLDRWIPASAPALLPAAPESPATQLKLIPIATPVHFSGFTPRTLDAFGPALRGLGLEPLQGTGGSSGASEFGDPATLRPGSMISVGLIRGDLNVHADGSVTHIDGGRVYGFGHRFLSSGPTELPFMRATVLALVPSLAHSMKISSAGPLMGTIRQDRSTGIYGELGRRPRLIPVELNVYSSRRGNQPFRIELVRDRYLSAFLLQMAVFSALDAGERLLGPSTVQMRGAIQFQGGLPAVELDNVYAGEAGLPSQVALGAALPLAYLMQSGFSDLAIDRVRLDLRSLDERQQLRLERAWTSAREARPGERIELAVALRAEDGAETIRRVPFQVPAGAAAGSLNITFADGAWMNLLDLPAGGRGREVSSAAQLVRAINQLRRNSNLYARVWRSERGYQLQGETLPSPPASLRNILAGPAGGGSISSIWSLPLAELEIPGTGAALSGSETIRLTVKE